MILCNWIPACAGMTKDEIATAFEERLAMTQLPSAVFSHVINLIEYFS